MFRREILEATRALCNAGGALAWGELFLKLQRSFEISREDFLFLMDGCPRFLLVPGPEEVGGEQWGGCTVVARTSLRLCRAYYHGECADVSCQNLHMCRFRFYGNCRFDKGRFPCRFSHEFRSTHNYDLLRECTLHKLNDDQLILLLLLNDKTLVPEVCFNYNRGSAPLGNCTFQENCTRLHLCMRFVQGDCAFGQKCKRQHAIDQHGRRMLEGRGLTGDLIQQLPSLYRNIYHLRRANTEERVEPQDETKEICLHFIRKSCKYSGKCHRVHFHLPYKWEVLNGVTWTILQDMEDIERDFCDPAKTQSSGNQTVDFGTMRLGSRPVRRLSTASSVTKPPHYVLTTDWLWYYKGNRGDWIEYGKPDEKQRTTSMTSQTLEKLFMVDRNAEVKVVKGLREYVLSFKDMCQRNFQYNNKRRVRRRPRFVPVFQVQRLYAQ